ncbi:uncharacterized protein C8Q71DRAFT_897953 [Rhodofomes roseus]|uniref:Uncharacterized protein n=1 Tax=Rhodofomes roseus TaxID=34475 RepID=A0ABQ8KJD4_9APHY|nr:uncharacterized protein C8Q71DRAFT_897953 [Rhodofomes roseus]KAH9837623.1 hypothetical protein C8Q71DRAFT_897953 [Rhodofomes roseus]
MANVSLGHGPIVIPLTEWVENRISAIYKAPNQREFSTAFDEFVDEHAHITVNGKQLNRDQYKELFQGERALESSATVSFLGAVEVPANKKEHQSAGHVGVYYKAIVYERLVFGADRESRTVNSSLNVVVKDGGNLEGHRVTGVDQVIISEPNPVRFH